MADKTIVVAVNLDTKQATSNAAELNGEIAKLRATTAGLKRDQALLASLNQENTAEYKALSQEIAINDAQIKKLSADYAQQVKILQANSGSMEELRAITAAMTKQADRFRVGIDGTADDLDNLKESVRKNIEEIRAFDLAQGKAQANVGNYEVAIKNAIKTLNDENATLRQNKEALKEVEKQLQDSTKDQASELNKQKLSLQQNIGQMEGRLDEFGDRVAKGNKEMFNTFADVGAGITSAFAIAPLINFGDENKSVAEIAAYSQRAIAIATNAKTIAIAASSAADAKDMALAQLKSIYLKKNIVLTNAETAAVGRATVAQRIWNFVMSLNPIALVITAVAALVGWLVIYGDSTKEATEATKKQNDALEKNVENMEKNAAAAKKLRDSQTELFEARVKLTKASEIEKENAIHENRMANLQAEIKANDAAIKKQQDLLNQRAKFASEGAKGEEARKEANDELIATSEKLRDMFVMQEEFNNKVQTLEATHQETLKKLNEDATKKEQEEQKKRADNYKKYLDDLQKLRDELDKADADATKDQFERAKKEAAAEFNIAKRELKSRVARTEEEKDLINKLIVARREELHRKLADIDKQAEEAAAEEAKKRAEDRANNLAAAYQAAAETVKRTEEESQLAVDQQLANGVISKEKAEKKKDEIHLESLEHQKEVAELFGEDTLALDQAITDEKIKNAEKELEAKKQLKELEKQAAKEAFDLILLMYQNNLEQQQQALSQKQSDELAKLQKLKDSSAITEEQYAQRKAAIDDRYNKQAAEIKRKQFMADRRATELRVIMNTAEAISKSLAQGGGLFSAPLIAITAGLGALQLAAIESQPIPTFAKGGFTGRGILGPDSTGKRPAGIVHANEYVVPERVMNNPIGANLVSQLEMMRGSAYPGYANGGLVADVTGDAIDYDRLGMTLAKYIPSEVNVNSINRGQSQVQVRASRGALVNPGA